LRQQQQREFFPAVYLISQLALRCLLLQLLCYWVRELALKRMQLLALAHQRSAPNRVAELQIMLLR
jgi:hypothetical protein